MPHASTKLSVQNKQFVVQRAQSAGTNISRALEEIISEARLREELKAEQDREEKSKR